MSVCVCAQYLRGESGNENNLSLIRTRSLCCPGHAWHLWPSLGSTFALYSRAGPRSYASPYNWFASVPKSTHKAMPDFTRFLFKEKRWHRQQETVVIYHLQFLTRIFRGEKERNSGWSHGMCFETLSLSHSRFVLFFCCLLDSCPKKVKCWLTLKKSELGACVVNDLTALLFKNWNEVRPFESSDSQVLWTWPAILVLRPAGKWVPEFICTLFPWQIILLFSHSWFAFILLANDRLRQSDLLSLCYMANAPQLGLFPQWQSIFALHTDRKIDWEFNAQELAAERFIKRDFLICDTKKLHYDAKILPWDTWKPNLNA